MEGPKEMCISLFIQTLQQNRLDDDLKCMKYTRSAVYEISSKSAELRIYTLKSIYVLN